MSTAEHGVQADVPEITLLDQQDMIRQPGFEPTELRAEASFPVGCGAAKNDALSLPVEVFLQPKEALAKIID